MAKEGIPFILLFIIGALVARMVLPGSKAVPIILVLLAAFSAYFFRDPERVVPVGENLIISPADGKVVFVGQVDDAHYFDGPAKKVSIFMSLFDVHVNRSPVSFPGECGISSITKGGFSRPIQTRPHWITSRTGSSWKRALISLRSSR